MKFTITYNPTKDVIEASIQGEITMEDVKTVLFEACQLINTHGCYRCITDCREAHLKLSTLEIYTVPRLSPIKIGPEEIHLNRLKRAILVSQDSEDFHFYETAALNTGQRVKVFRDPEEAWDWLLPNQNKPN